MYGGKEKLSSMSPQHLNLLSKASEKGVYDFAKNFRNENVILFSPKIHQKQKVISFFIIIFLIFF